MPLLGMDPERVRGAWESHLARTKRTQFLRSGGPH
jgi:hypothetical protein